MRAGGKPGRHLKVYISDPEPQNHSQSKSHETTPLPPYISLESSLYIEEVQTRLWIWGYQAHLKAGLSHLKRQRLTENLNTRKTESKEQKETVNLKETDNVKNKKKVFNYNFPKEKIFHPWNKSRVL